MTTTISTAPALRLRSIIGYGAGDAANNLAFTTATMFLLVYYTDVAGISAAAAGTLLLVVRIFDAFADVFAGRIVDATNTKRFGKFRPFLLFGSVPLLVLSVLTFTVPQIGETGVLIYAYLTYAALGFAYSLVNIPYGSLAGAMTQNPTERAKLASARTIGATIVGAALGIFVTPLLSRDFDMQTLFTMMTLGFVVVGTGLYLFTFFTAKETVVRDVAQVTLKQSMQTLVTNRPLMLLCAASFLMLIGMFANSAVQIYFLRDVLLSLGLSPILSMGQLVLAFAAAPFVPLLVRRLGKRSTFVIFSVIGAVGYASAFFFTNVWLVIVSLLVANVGVLVVGMVLWALEADTVEYGEWKTGVRTEGTTYAVFSFTRKTGQAVGGALGAFMLAFGGYSAAVTVQSDATQFWIRAGATLLPVVFLVLAVLVMLAYPLTDARHAEIVAEIEARRARAGDSDPVAPELSTAAFRSDSAHAPLDPTDSH